MMSVQTLIELSKIRELSEEGYEFLQKVRERQREFDIKLEKQVQLKRVDNELLNKTCSI